LHDNFLEEIEEKAEHFQNRKAYPYTGYCVEDMINKPVLNIHTAAEGIVVGMRDYYGHGPVLVINESSFSIGFIMDEKMITEHWIMNMSTSDLPRDVFLRWKNQMRAHKNQQLVLF
jgi:hypothetical protein